MVKTDVSNPSPEELSKAGIPLNHADLKIDDLSCTPNPSSGKFTLSFSSPDKSPAEITVRDINGKIIYSEMVKDFSGKYEKEIRLGETSKGLYFVSIGQGRHTSTRKLLVQ